MKQIITSVRNKIARFLDDEEGYTAIETIMLIAISAIFVIGIFTLGKNAIMPWVVGIINQLLGKSGD